MLDDISISIYRKSIAIYMDAISVDISEDVQILATNSFFQIYETFKISYPVKVKSVDLFKVYAWFPYILLKHKDSLDGEELIHISMDMLDNILHLRGKRIDKNWRKKIQSIACNGFLESLEDISFAKIGLYSSYKTASHTNQIPKELPEDLLDTLEGVV